MRTFAAILIACLLAAPIAAQEQKDKQFVASQWAFAGAVGFDAYATARARGTRARNPFEPDNRYAAAGYVGGIGAGVLVASHYVHRRHPMAARLILWLGTAAHVAAGILSVRAGR